MRRGRDDPGGKGHDRRHLGLRSDDLEIPLQLPLRHRRSNWRHSSRGCARVVDEGVAQELADFLAARERFVAARSVGGSVAPSFVSVPRRLGRKRQLVLHPVPGRRRPTRRWPLRIMSARREFGTRPGWRREPRDDAQMLLVRSPLPRSPSWETGAGATIRLYEFTVGAISASHRRHSGPPVRPRNAASSLPHALVRRGSRKSGCPFQSTKATGAVPAAAGSSLFHLTP